MRGLKDTLRRKGHALLGDPRIASMLQERVLTLRNGRHAFLVRQDAISQFPGAVIERSGSGNSVYMEPHSLMSLNNEYSKLYGEEMLEETRIFREFTALRDGAPRQMAHARPLEAHGVLLRPRAPSSARREVRADRHQMRR